MKAITRAQPTDACLTLKAHNLRLSRRGNQQTNSDEQQSALNAQLRATRLVLSFRGPPARRSHTP